jgi:uncharacterized membrane protein HdeD (DUF308 family)
MEALHKDPFLIYSNVAPLDRYDPNLLNQTQPRQFAPPRLLLIGAFACFIGGFVLGHVPYTFWVCAIIGMLTLVTIGVCICMLAAYEHHHPNETCWVRTFASLGVMLVMLSMYLGCFLGRSGMGWTGQNEDFLDDWRHTFIVQITMLAIFGVCSSIIMSTRIYRLRELRSAPGKILLTLFSLILVFMLMDPSIEGSGARVYNNPEKMLDQLDVDGQKGKGLRCAKYTFAADDGQGEIDVHRCYRSLS